MNIDTNDELTPQERQNARLAYEGFADPEIGQQLRKLFTKLGINSRRELANALRGLNFEPAPL